MENDAVTQTTIDGIPIIYKDITGVLGEEVCVCALQLKSPFYDECEPRQIGGDIVLSWDTTALRKRKEKIINILNQMINYKPEIKIVLLPEYSLPYDLLDDLKKFADNKDLILVGTFYNDRKDEQYYRKNLCAIILPKIGIEKFCKLERTSYEADFVSNLKDEEKKVFRFYWQLTNKNKLYFQIFICSDFLSHFESIDRELGGIILVPMNSPETEEFRAPSKWCIRPQWNSKTSRCVFLCNSVTLPEWRTDPEAIGGTQIFGPYQGGLLPRLGKEVEGGVIATIRPSNLITKPSAIPSEFNIVIENPISFLLREKNGILELEQIEIPIKKKKWVVNPDIFESLGLSKYFTFGKLRSYYHFRPILQKSSTKCFGIIGTQDIVTTSLAEEASDAMMLFYQGRSDLAAALERQFYFKVTDFFKYKGKELKYQGKKLIPKVSTTRDEIENSKEYLYKLATGIEDGISKNTIEELSEKKLILGEEDANKVKNNEKEEFLVGIFLPMGIIETGETPCEVFERECIDKYLLKNPKVKSIYFSSGGGGGGERINLHYILHVVGTIWDIKNMVLDYIHKPLYDDKVECGTRVMPIIDYLSDLEYEALSYTSIIDSGKRRDLREITDYASYKLGENATFIRRLPLHKINAIISIYNIRNRLKDMLEISEDNMRDAISKFIRGLVYTQMKQLPENNQKQILIQIYEDFSPLYGLLAREAEGILHENIENKKEQVGANEFKERLKKAAGKEIYVKPELGPLIIATSVWNNNYKDDPIVDQDYGEFINKKLQHNKVDEIRNYFFHTRKTKRHQFLKNFSNVKNDANKVLNALIVLTEFVEKYNLKVS